MMRTVALATTLVMTLASAGATQVVVQGTVVNPDSARLVAVQIELSDSSGRIRHSTTTDSLGQFSIRLAAPLMATRYSIRAERLGYLTTRSSLDVADRQVVEIVLTMAVAAIPLEPLRVTTRRRYARAARDEYYDRLDRVRRMGGGIIIDYDQLQRRLGSTIANLVAEQYPGQRNCPPSYFIDGMRAIPEDLRTLSVTSLEGIEIYRSVAHVPVQYQNRANCGAVLIWTQVGDRGAGSPLTWRRVLIAAGLFGVGWLIFFR